MTLITTPESPIFDRCYGQRTATFRFDAVDAVTGYRTQVYPIRDSVPVLTHDTERTITRQITGLLFGVADTALLNIISSRLEVSMLIKGETFPLGRYIFNSQIRLRYSSGILSNASAFDEMFIVDQQLEQSFAASGVVSANIIRLLAGLPITYTLEPTVYTSNGSWYGGSARGYAVEQLAIDGDYFSPWFDNTNIMRFIRSFDPAVSIPTFDFDVPGRVMSDRIIETDDLITAPNRFIVISNGTSTEDTDTPTAGRYDVPASAPHSILNRGFVIPSVEDRQLSSSTQADAVARNLGLRQTIFERVELTTPPDPRHNSYDILRWQGANWLETAWSMPLIEGGQMQHIARKAYVS